MNRPDELRRRIFLNEQLIQIKQQENEDHRNELERIESKGTQINREAKG